MDASDPNEARGSDLLARLRQLADEPAADEATGSGSPPGAGNGAAGVTQIADALGVIVAESVHQVVRESMEGIFLGLEPRLAALEQRLDTVTGQLGAQLEAQLEAQREAQLGVADSGPATSNGALDALRADIADALEFVRDDVVQQTESTADLTAAALAETNRSLDGLPELLQALAAALTDSGQGLDAASGELRAASVELASAGDGLRAATGGLVEDAGLRLEQRAAQVQDAVQAAVQEQLALALEALSGQVAEVRETVADALSAGRQSTAEALAGLQGAEGQRQRHHEELMVSSHAVLDRVTAAGRRLVDYLGERDLLLERERDEAVRRLLADALAGLPERDRERAAGLLSRRRDARDAQRWRGGRSGEAGSSARAASGLPATESELLGLLDAQSAKSAASAESAESPDRAAGPSATTTATVPVVEEAAAVQAAAPRKRAPRARPASKTAEPPVAPPPDPTERPSPRPSPRAGSRGKSAARTGPEDGSQATSPSSSPAAPKPDPDGPKAAALRPAAPRPRRRPPEDG